MDFIDGLPKSEGYSVILVVVDRLTKYAHFMPLKHPYTSSSVALVLFNNIVKLHGVPKTIVSDRDKVFTSNVWKELFRLLDTQLCTSSSYHAPTGGQSERVNQCLETYLRCAVSSTPKQWLKWLPLAELWYNSSYHTSLKCSLSRHCMGWILLLVQYLFSVILIVMLCIFHCLKGSSS
jgi:hypothetical protein